MHDKFGMHSFLNMYIPFDTYIQTNLFYTNLTLHKYTINHSYNSYVFHILWIFQSDN